MPYTLMKGLAWVILAVLLGIVIGWLLRSVAAKRQVARARAEHVDAAEMERLRGRVANLESVVAERDRLQDELSALRPGASQPSAAAAAGGDDREIDQVPHAPDVSIAAQELGRSITLDDLKAVEGIGPKIEELCHGIGIRTWYDLSVTEVSLLRTMLADAGARFRSHDPSTWPQQAGLLARGSWSEFKVLTDRLDGGRSVD